MCGRFFIEIDDMELWRVASEAGRKMMDSPWPSGQQMKTSGEVFPTDIVPVQTGAGEYQPMRWGFVGYNGKPVINARSETALEKPMFQKSMLERRCLIPASGYYEWQKEGSKKTKYQFFIPGSPLYFAGCWRREQGSPVYTFVILTRQATGGAEAIHDRMPVIIPRSRMDAWLSEGASIMREAVTDLTYQRAA